MSNMFLVDVRVESFRGLLTSLSYSTLYPSLKTDIDHLELDVVTFFPKQFLQRRLQASSFKA